MEMTEMTKTVLTTVIAAVLATSAGSALASHVADPQTVSTVVRYGDLNLENPEGARTLLSRIRSAARTVCEPEPSSNLVEIDEWRGCLANATEGAVARVNAPMVTAAFTGKRTGSVHLAQNTPH
jgi:UrcA family protein